jgi:hypothetical protein
VREIMTTDREYPEDVEPDVENDDVDPDGVDGNSTPNGGQ